MNELLYEEWSDMRNQAIVRKIKKLCLFWEDACITNKSRAQLSGALETTV